MTEEQTAAGGTKQQAADTGWPGDVVRGVLGYVPTACGAGILSLVAPSWREDCETTRFSSELRDTKCTTSTSKYGAQINARCGDDLKRRARADNGQNELNSRIDNLVRGPSDALPSPEIVRDIIHYDITLGEFSRDQKVSMLARLLDKVISLKLKSQRWNAKDNVTDIIYAMLPMNGIKIGRECCGTNSGLLCELIESNNKEELDDRCTQFQEDLTEQNLADKAREYFQSLSNRIYAGCNCHLLESCVEGMLDTPGNITTEDITKVLPLIHDCSPCDLFSPNLDEVLGKLLEKAKLQSDGLYSDAECLGLAELCRVLEGKISQRSRGLLLFDGPGPGPGPEPVNVPAFSSLLGV